MKNNNVAWAIRNYIDGKYFSFEILTQKDCIDIGLTSRNQFDMQYQSVDKDELKGLADFIYNYLENNL